MVTEDTAVQVTEAVTERATEVVTEQVTEQVTRWVTEQATQAATEAIRTETVTRDVTRDIERILQEIRGLDHLRSEETHDVAENVRVIHDELRLLSEYVRNRLVTTERVVVTTPAGPPPVPRRDRSVGRSSVVTEPRANLAGPRDRLHLIPVEMSPPLTRTASITSSALLVCLTFHRITPMMISCMGNTKLRKEKNTKSRHRLPGRRCLRHRRRPIPLRRLRPLLNHPQDQRFL